MLKVSNAKPEAWVRYRKELSTVGAAQEFCARSAAFRPSNPKPGLLGAAAREPAAQGKVVFASPFERRKLPLSFRPRLPQDPRLTYRSYNEARFSDSLHSALAHCLRCRPQLMSMAYPHRTVCYSNSSWLVQGFLSRAPMGFGRPQQS
jgi:hypothetical protein